MTNLLKLKFFIGLFFCFANAWAQNVELLLGDTINKNAGSFQLITSDKTSIFVFRLNISNSKKFYLEKYNRETLQRTSRIAIPFSDKDTVNFHIEHLIIHDNYYQLFYSYFNKDLRRENLEMIRFNERGERDGDQKVLDYLEGKNERKAGSYDVRNLNDEEGFVLNVYKYDNDTNILIRKYFDYSGNKLSENKFFLEEDFGHPMLWIVDKYGNMAFLSSSKPEKRSPDIRLRIYPKNSDSVINLSFEKPAKYDIYLAPRFNYFFSEDGLLNIVTTYAATPTAENSFGFYWLQIDLEDYKVVNEKFVKFKKARMTDFDEDFYATSCIITNIELNENGGYGIQFESRLKVTTTVYGAAVSHTYIFGNICELNVDSNLSELNLMVIKKSQNLPGPKGIYCGHLHLKSKGQKYIMFNDLPENLTGNSKVKKLNGGKLSDAIIASVQFHDSVMVEKKMVNYSDVTEKPGWLFTDSYMYLTNHECVFIGKNRNSEVERLMKFYVYN